MTSEWLQDMGIALVLDYERYINSNFYPYCPLTETEARLLGVVMVGGKDRLEGTKFIPFVNEYRYEIWAMLLPD